MIFQRTILKQTVAMKFYPHSINPQSAMQLLRIEINETPHLKEKLEKENRKKRSHYFTERQLLILLEHFDYTTEEFEKL